MGITQYRTINDGDGHEYIIPLEKSGEFYRWLAAIDSYYNNCCQEYIEAPNEEVPEWAIQVNGLVTFTDYEII